MANQYIIKNSVLASGLGQYMAAFPLGYCFIIFNEGNLWSTFLMHCVKDAALFLSYHYSGLDFPMA